MSFNIKVGGTWQVVQSAWVKVGGTWQQLASAWVKVAGTWQQVLSSFFATASDTTPSGTDSGAAPSGVVTSDVTTVTPTGGTAPYTYLWEQTGTPATSGPFSAAAGTSAATAFTATVGALDAVKYEDWKCTVTDADLNTAEVTVTVTLTWVDIT